MGEDLFRDKPSNTNPRLSMALPIPPSINHMYYNTRGGGKRLTIKAENYVRISKALINLAMEEQRWNKPSKHTWLYADLVFYFPDRRRRDSHNTLKLLLDVMNKLVYEDDYTCLPRIQSVEYDKDNPRVEILITQQNITNREIGRKMTNV